MHKCVHAHNAPIKKHLSSDLRAEDPVPATGTTSDTETGDPQTPGPTDPAGTTGTTATGDDTVVPGGTAAATADTDAAATADGTPDDIAEDSGSAGLTTGAATPGASHSPGHRS